MQILLSTYESRGDVEPMLEPAARSLVSWAPPPSAADLTLRACDAPVATGVMNEVWR
jgi:hypothetical protein